MLVTLVWLFPMIVFFILTSIIASVPISIAVSYFTKKRFLTTFIPLCASLPALQFFVALTSMLNYPGAWVHIVAILILTIIASILTFIAVSYFTKKRFLTTFIIIFSITFILVTLISLGISTAINHSNNSEKLHWVD